MNYRARAAMLVSIMLVGLSGTAFLFLPGGPENSVQTVSYNIYFGNLHSHTAYSDGNQDAATSGVHNVAGSFAYAKQAHQLDFLAITEHNHNTAGLKIANWYNGLSETSAATTDTTFAPIFGQEWGVISGGGHVIVLGTSTLYGWETVSGAPNYQVYVAKNDYTSLFNAVKADGGFIFLAHPQTGDYTNFFTSFNSTAVGVVVGSAVVSGPAFSTSKTLSDPASSSSTSGYVSKFHQALALGYRVGPTADQDTHNTVFGEANEERTAVYAASRTPAAILDGLKNRRFYATQDKNLRVALTVNGSVMGQEISTPGNVSIAVSVSDPDAGSTATKIEIRYGVPGSGASPTVLTSASNSSTLSYNWNQPNGTTYYFYAYVEETENSQTRSAWTSPVWNKRDNALPVELTSFVVSPNRLAASLSWRTATESNNYGFEIERQPMINEQLSINNWTKVGFVQGAGTSTSPREYQFNDRGLASGRYAYRLKQLDRDGSFAYSEVMSAEIGLAPHTLTLSDNYPNPFNPTTKFEFTLPNDGRAALKVYNSIGQTVAILFDGEAVGGRIYQTEFDSKNLPSAVYLAELSFGTERIVKKMLLLR